MPAKIVASEEKIGRVGQRRQVVIPREMLETLNIREGDFVAFREQSDGVLIKPKRVVDPDDVLTRRRKRPNCESTARNARGKIHPPRPSRT